MANTIKIKRKTTTGAPLLSSLVDGEMCLVVPDEKLYQRVNGTTLILLNNTVSFTSGTAAPNNGDGEPDGNIYYQTA